MDLRTLLKSSGVRNFSKLLSANVVAQVIGLVVYPILTRMYAPEDFGLLNLLLSISGVLVIFSTAEYYNASVFQDKEQFFSFLLQSAYFRKLYMSSLVPSYHLYYSTFVLFQQHLFHIAAF